MHGGDDERPPEIDGGKARRQRRRQHGVAGQSRLDVPQRVDPGISGHVDDACRDAFAEQRSGGPRRRREMQVGDLGDGAAVHFLGKRLGLARPQAGLDMDERPARIGRRLRPGKGRGGIALDDHRGGAHPITQRRQRRHQRTDDIGGRLRRSHDRQVGIGGKAESGKRFVEQFAMLPGRDQKCRPPASPQRKNDRRKFYGFGTGTRHKQKSAIRQHPYPHLSTLIQVQCCRKGACSLCQY